MWIIYILYKNTQVMDDLRSYLHLCDLRNPKARESFLAKNEMRRSITLVCVCEAKARKRLAYLSIKTVSVGDAASLLLYKCTLELSPLLHVAPVKLSLYSCP